VHSLYKLKPRPRLYLHRIDNNFSLITQKCFVFKKFSSLLAVRDQDASSFRTKLLYCCAENKSKEFPTKLFFLFFIFPMGTGGLVEQTVTNNDNGNEQAQPWQWQLKLQLRSNSYSFSYRIGPKLVCKKHGNKYGKWVRSLVIKENYDDFLFGIALNKIVWRENKEP